MAENIVIEPNVGSRGSAFTDSFFRDVPVDLRYLKTVYQNFLPINSIQNAKHINFKLDAWHNNTFYLLDRILMVVRLRLKKMDGSDIGKTKENIGVVNMPLHSIFDDVKLYLNELNVNPMSGHYNYKQIIETVLSTSPEGKTSYMQNAGYYPDTSDAMNALDATNEGLTLRAALFRNVIVEAAATQYEYDRSPTFCDYVRLDMENTPPLLNGVSVRIEFTLAPYEFVLMQRQGSPACKYVVESMYLRVPSVIVEPKSYERIQGVLNEHRLAQYSFRRRHIQHMVLPTNTKTYTSDTLFPAAIAPSRLVLALVVEGAFRGRTHLNPYNFAWGDADGQGSQLQSVALTLNGESVDGLPTDEKSVWFHKLYQFTGLRNHSLTNGISMQNFLGGYYFNVFDLSTSLNASTITVSPAVRSGFLRLEIDFTAQLQQNWVAILWCEFPSLLTIDANRNIQTNYLQGGYSQ